MTKLAVGILMLACAAPAGTLYLGAYPDAVLVFDEAQGKIVERIPLTTGLPVSLRLSQDRKKIYVTTLDHSGIEVIDIATRKVTNKFVLNTETKRYRMFGGVPDPEGKKIYVTTLDHSGIEVIDIATRKVTNKFVLNTETKRYRMFGGVPDPEGKLIYTTTTEIDKQIDRYEIAKPKYTVIDLVAQKIARTVDMPREEENGFGGRGPLEVSPDGKYLYQFRDRVIILNTSDFKEVERIELSKPELPGLETVGFGGVLDSLNTDPGQRVTLFNSVDPIVHNRVFGIGRFDLTTR